MYKITPISDSYTRQINVLHSILKLYNLSVSRNADFFICDAAYLAYSDCRSLFPAFELVNFETQCRVIHGEGFLL